MDMTLDKVGLHRAKQQYKSQPRNVQYNPNNVSPSKPPMIPNIKNTDIQFGKKVSQRQERLSKYYVKNPIRDNQPRRLVQQPNNLTFMDRKDGHFESIKKSTVNRLNNLSAMGAARKADLIPPIQSTKKDVTPSRRELNPYKVRTDAADVRAQSTHKDRSMGVLPAKSKYNDFEYTRNEKVGINKSSLPKDRNLIGGPINLKTNLVKQDPLLPVQHLNPSYTGSVSENDFLLNKMLKQRRNEMEKLTKNSFMGLV